MAQLPAKFWGKSMERDAFKRVGTEWQGVEDEETDEDGWLWWQNWTINFQPSG